MRQRYFLGISLVKIVRLILILVCLSLLVACGQKGDLYFPEQRTGVVALVESVSWLENYGLL